MSTKILIAYFSHWGHTRQLAELIADLTGGDLFEITTDHHYPVAHDPCSAQAHQEQLADFRPHLTSQVAKMDQYETVLIGHLIWWYRAPMVIRSFEESYDLTGKTLIPFCTSGDVGIEQTEADLRQMVPAATVLPGLRLGSLAVATSRQRVIDWLKADGVPVKEEAHDKD